CDTGGVNLWFGNNPGAGASFHVTDPVFGDVADQPRVSRAIAEAAEGRSLSWRAVSSFFARRAATWALAHPRAGPRLAGRKRLAFLSRFEFCLLSPAAAGAGVAPPTRVFSPPAGVVLALAALGIASLRGRPRGAPSAAPLVLFALSVLLQTVLF